MKLYRTGLAVAAVAAAAVALTACGSDNNGGTGGSSSDSSSSSSAPTGSGSSSGTANGGITCAKGSLQLAGSTAQTNAMSTWIKNYQQACPGSSINYGGGGSGQGVQNFEDKTIDFAGSDFPLSGDDVSKANARCGSGQAINLPMVPGPIAIGFNLPGVTSLNLSASVLAKIFSGKITKWNDSAIKADNSGANLPNAKITTYHRSDGSGTSFNFTNYLMNEAKSDWTYGANKTWPAPGGIGSKGTAGIAQGVKSTQGGIGYMEQSYATQNKITYAKVGNAGGKFVELTNDNVAKFLSSAKVTGSNNNLPLQFDYSNTDTDAYPNLLVTYEIVCASGNDSSKLPLIKGFLSYIVSDTGQALLPDNGYVSLPKNIQTQVQTAVSAIS